MILIVNQGNTPSSELQHCLQRVNADCALATSMATALHKCTHEFVPVIVLALSPWSNASMISALWCAKQ